MSHYKLKTKYNEDLGTHTIEKILYAHHNLSCDVVSFYDQDGNHIFSVPDTIENNIFDAMVRLYSPFLDGKLNNLIEHMSHEEREILK